MTATVSPAPPDKKRGFSLFLTSPHLAAALAIFIFAVNYIVGRGVRDDVPPYTLSFVRWAGAAVILLPFALRAVREDWPVLTKAWRIIVPCGFLMPFVGAGLAYVALTYTFATNAGVIQISLPVLTILIAAATIGERLTMAKVVGSIIAIVGVRGIIARGDPAVISSLDFNTGDLILLACNLGLACYSVLIKIMPRVRPVSLLFALCVLGALFHLPSVAAEMLAGEFVNPSWIALGGLVFVALFPSIGAIFLWNYSIAELGPSRSGAYMFLVPVFSAGLAYLFLGEIIAWYHVAGAALIVIGVVLTGRGQGSR